MMTMVHMFWILLMLRRASAKPTRRSWLGAIKGGFEVKNGDFLTVGGGNCLEYMEREWIPMLKTWSRFIQGGVMAATAFAAAYSFGQYNPRALIEPATGAIAAPEAYMAQWPLEMDGPVGKVAIFQPQMEELSGDMLSARSAVSIAKQGGEPAFGVVWFKSRVSIDRSTRVVRPIDVTITQTRIPDTNADTEQAVREAIARGITSPQSELAYDQLVEMLETRPQVDAGLKFEAPKVLFLERPTMKVQYDGEPKLMKANDSALERVVNTPFFVVKDPGSNTIYLKGGGVWFEATDAKGPFARSSRVPPEVIALADRSGYKDPQEPLAAEQLDRLNIITATEPTELVWTDGVPQMGAVPGTGLLYVTNTESNVFVDVQSQRTYVLLSGRWYEAANRSGPWAYVPPGNLPGDFSKIPSQSERGEVLAHIAGTPQAQQAVADAQIPQTAAVSRKNFQQPKVEYDGDPFFEPVEGTSLSYAANTAQSVVRVDNMYYACYDAVWYQSASPYGPWDLCTSVPNEVYNIPASSPVYPVRYVYVYGSTPEYVYTGYTPGYLGTYAYDGAVVYGTGYYYRPWYGNYYYPRAYTYGFGARYDGDNWGFSFGYGWGGGSLWLGYNSGYYGYCDPWFGYSGYYPYYGYGYRNYPYRYGYYGHHAYHDHHDYHGDRHDHYAHSNEDRARNNRDDDRNQRANAFGNQRRQSSGGELARSANVYDRRGDVQRTSDSSARARNSGDRSAGQPPRSDPDSRRNDVVADREGRVFRRADDGNWQSRSDGAWRSEGRTPTALANEPAARRADRQATARANESRVTEARLSNPGTPRVSSEDRARAGSSEPRAGRSAPVNREPEVIRPRTSTPQNQTFASPSRTNAQTGRSNPFIRSTPQNERNSRNQVADNSARRNGNSPPLTMPQTRDDSARSSSRDQDNSNGSGIRPGRVAPREAAPREPAPRVTTREPAPRIAPQQPQRSASRESLRSAPPESRPRAESRPAPAPRSEPRASAAPRAESRSSPRSSDSAPRSSGGGSSGGGRFDSGRSTGGGGAGRNR